MKKAAAWLPLQEQHTIIATKWCFIVINRYKGLVWTRDDRLQIGI